MPLKSSQFTPAFSIRINKRLKQARLLINAEDGLVVETPQSISETTAKNLIQNKSEWVEKTLRLLQKKEISKKARLEISGSGLLIFGIEKKIQINGNQKRPFIFENKSTLFIGIKGSTASKQEIKNQLETYLKQRAKTVLAKRTKALCRQNFKINKVTIKDQKSRWGSCSSDLNINLSWRLIMAPPYVCDSIIIHELCHTKHLNHSKKFWDLVDHFDRHRKKADQWINDHGSILHRWPKDIVIEFLSK